MIQNRRALVQQIAARSLTLTAGGVVYVVIGRVRAEHIGGFYPWTSAAADLLGAAVVLLLMWSVGFGVSAGLQRLLPRSVRGRTGIIVGVMTVYVVLGVIPFVLTLAQFCPQRVACRRMPADLGVKHFENVRLKSDGLEIAGWYLPGDGSHRPLLVVHGIGANKDNFLEPAVALNALGHPVLTIDLRAHGDSGGRVCTIGWRESHDVSAALEWLSRRHPGRLLGALAYSMGAAAAIRSAAETGKIDRLCVDSTFARAESVARQTVLRRFGPLQEPVWQLGRGWAWLLTGMDMARHNPEDALRQAKLSGLLVIHGAVDPMIPLSEAERLRDAAPCPVELWKVPGAAHVGSLLHHRYLQRVHEFFEAR